MNKFTLTLILFGIAFISCGQQQMKPEDTEVWEPVPVKVTPGAFGAPPSDAIILLGTDFSEWQSERGGEATWDLEEGIATVLPRSGGIVTKRKFGDIQLHIEWRSPAVIEAEGQGRGNSGVFLMQKYEVQVLDSYTSKTYSNGQAGSIYKQFIPQVNATRPPEEWQSYDIIFEAPVFEGEKLVKPAFMTVLHNGVLIHNHVELKGPTAYIGHPSYKVHPEKLPISLQDHGNLVSYRNIWVRELN